MPLDAKTTARGLIDWPKGIMATPVAPDRRAGVWERAMQLAQRVRAAPAPVVRVRVSLGKDHVLAPRLPVDPPSNVAALPAGWDDSPDQPEREGDSLVTKHQWGAFQDTDREVPRRRRGIQGIVLGGVSTNIGVESTAREARERGFEVVIAEDLCSSSSSEMQAFSLKPILPRLARVTRAASIGLV